MANALQFRRAVAKFLADRLPGVGVHLLVLPEGARGARIVYRLASGTTTYDFAGDDEDDDRSSSQGYVECTVQIIALHDTADEAAALSQQADDLLMQQFKGVVNGVTLYETERTNIVDDVDRVGDRYFPRILVDYLIRYQED